jgi:hypothetical protein
MQAHYTQEKIHQLLVVKYNEASQTNEFHNDKWSQCNDMESPFGDHLSVGQGIKDKFFGDNAE